MIIQQIKFFIIWHIKGLLISGSVTLQDPNFWRWFYSILFLTGLIVDNPVIWKICIIGWLLSEVWCAWMNPKMREKWNEEKYKYNPQ